MNKIIIDGKEYELSAELVEKIEEEVAAQEKKKKEDLKEPFGRVHNERYFLINGNGRVSTMSADTNSPTDDELYAIGNYCRDKGLMEQRALHERLNRLLWRYSETHGGENAWDSQNIQAHYYIYLDTQNSVLYVSYNDAYHIEGVVYFKEEYIAENAITEVVKPFMEAHPEFVW